MGFSGGNIISIFLMWLASSTAIVQSNDHKYCDNYLLCAHQLEFKQRECIDLEERQSAQSQTPLLAGSCEKAIHEARSSIHGLELRKTELNRDCVRKNIAMAESIMDPSIEAMCSKVAEKFSFVNRSLKEQKVKTSSKKKKDIKKTKIHECRRNAKVWHKQCRRLAKCCSIFPECSLESSDVQTQISKQRRRLENAKATCPRKAT